VAAARQPQGGPMPVEPRGTAPPELDRATAPTRDPTERHRRTIPPMAVHGTTGIQRKALAGTARPRATGVHRHLAGLFRPATRRRVVADLPCRDRTQPRARAIRLRSRTRAHAFRAVVDLPRRDRTQLRARAIPLRVRIRAREFQAVDRAPQADARLETQALPEAVREEAADAAGNVAGLPFKDADIRKGSKLRVCCPSPYSYSE
jgi:hypothetical protein